MIDSGRDDGEPESPSGAIPGGRQERHVTWSSNIGDVNLSTAGADGDEEDIASSLEGVREMMALLPSLRAIVEERWAAEEEMARQQQETCSPRSVSGLSEQGEEGGAAATATAASAATASVAPVAPSPPHGSRRCIYKSTVEMSTMQHVSKGLSATTRRYSDESSSCSSDSGDDTAALQGDAPTAEKQEYVQLSRDVYSLMYYSVPLSVTFFFSLGTFLFQIFILILIMLDIVDVESDNPVNIPAGVSTVVRIAQFVAILIAVATQDDLITAINELHMGYYREGLPGDGNGGARWQWLMSIVARFGQGGLCLSVTFMLVVQSVEVVQLFLDFLAVTFVSTLDDCMFSLAREGYFAHRLRMEARKMSKVRVPKKAIKSSLFRPCLFLLLSALMLMGWGFVMNEQFSGRYLSCTSISVQFGDDFLFNLGFFSGVYEISHFDRFHRPVYLEKKVSLGNGQEGKGMFAYCDSLGTWTFSFPQSQDQVADPCYWHAISSDTEVYDIMNLALSDWYVFDSDMKKPVPFQHFAMDCADCIRDVERGSCSSVGECIDNQCVCNDGRMGINCEYHKPCDRIHVNTEFGGFPGPIQWSERYDILHHCNTTEVVEVYHRPVYVSIDKNEVPLQVIVYTGRRWIVSEVNNLPPMPSTENYPVHHDVRRCLLAEFLSNFFHANWVDVRPEFMSSPTDVGTPTNAATPVSLDLLWFRTQTHNKNIDLYSPALTQLLCSICDEERNPCNNDGVCSKSSGKCICKAGFFGALCQIKNFALCRSIAVQLEDGMGLSLEGLSGVYHLLDNVTISGRVVYIDQQRRGAVFAYCEEEMAWTFTVLSDQKGNEGWVGDINPDTFDPCENSTAISPTTESYDISTVYSNWLVRRSRNASEFVPVNYFLLWCNDCNQNENPCKAGTCGSDGNCLCESNRYGLNCGLRDLCTELVVDQSFLRLELPTEFSALNHENGTNVVVNARPVFFGLMPLENETNFTMETDYALVLFCSRRWLTIVTNTFPAMAKGTTAEELAHFLSNDFHPYFSSYSVRYVSEPVSHSALPTNLKWYVSHPFSLRPADRDKPIDQKLMCVLCDNTENLCYNGGICTDRTCSCPRGTYGAHCQMDSFCKGLFLVFGSSVEDEIRLLSGEYDLTDMQTEDIAGPVYVLRGDSNAMIAYCFKLGHWTFAFLNSEGATIFDVHPCSDFFARSSLTSSLDILQALTWFVRTNGTEFAAMLPSTFSFVCSDPYYFPHSQMNSYQQPTNPERNTTNGEPIVPSAP